MTYKKSGKYDKTFRAARVKPLFEFQVHEPKQRDCLKCRKTFTSKGLFICPECTAANEMLQVGREIGVGHKIVRGRITNR